MHLIYSNWIQDGISFFGFYSFISLTLVYFHSMFFMMRLIVDTDGITSSEKPCCSSRYWIASAPTPRYFYSCSLPSIRVLRMFTTTCSISAFVFVPCFLGVLDLDLYQSLSPLLNRFIHLKNHFTDRFKSLQTTEGLSSSIYRAAASIRSCSSIFIMHHRRCIKGGVISEECTMY